jgi:hypothetical protein
MEIASALAQLARVVLSNNPDKILCSDAPDTLLYIRITIQSRVF